MSHLKCFKRSINIAILGFIYIFQMSCSNGGQSKDYFCIEDLSIRIVDLGNPNYENCNVVSNFSPKVGNEISGIGITIKKMFFSKEHYLNAERGGIENGLLGTTEKIIELKVHYISSNDTIDLSNRLKGNRDLSLKILQKRQVIGSDSVVQICDFTEYFDSIEDFILKYNNNDRSTIGERLKTEIFFWIEKKDLHSLKSFSSPTYFYYEVKIRQNDGVIRKISECLAFRD